MLAPTVTQSQLGMSLDIDIKTQNLGLLLAYHWLLENVDCQGQFG